MMADCLAFARHRRYNGAMQGTNPYETPQLHPPSPQGLSSHFVAALIMMPVAFIIGMLVTPADPISMFIATVPIFGAMFGAYIFGFRTGKKQAK